MFNNVESMHTQKRLLKKILLKPGKQLASSSSKLTVKQDIDLLLFWVAAPLVSVRVYYINFICPLNIDLTKQRVEIEKMTQIETNEPYQNGAV